MPSLAALEQEQRAGARALWTMMMPTDADVRPISMIRRTIAENLTRVVREVPQVTTFRTLDSTALEVFRREAGLSPLPIVVRALADVCKDHRSLNASYMAEQGQIWLHRRVHVGIATDTERGLLVPVVRDVGDLTLGEVAAEIQRLASAARDGSIRIEEMTGGTITVTNTGNVDLTNVTVVDDIIGLIILAAVGYRLSGPIVLAAASLRDFVLENQYFSVREIQVRGADKVSGNEIVTIAGLRQGMSIWKVELDRIEKKIAKHPWVRRVLVRREFPSRIIIDVAERTPKAIVAARKLYYVDSDGAVFKEVAPGENVKFPLLTGLRAEDVMAAGPAVELTADFTSGKLARVDVDIRHAGADSGNELFDLAGAP